MSESSDKTFVNSLDRPDSSFGVTFKTSCCARVKVKALASIGGSTVDKEDATVVSEVGVIVTLIIN